MGNKLNGIEEQSLEETKTNQILNSTYTLTK